MKVLQYLAPHAFGGIETVVRSLAIGMRARRWDVRVAAMVPPDGPGMEWVAAMQASGVRVDVLPPRGILADRRQLRALLAAWRPDILHTHGYRADILTAMAGRHRPTSTLSTVHGFTPHTLKLALYARADQAALRRFDRVITVSEAIRQLLVKRGVAPGRVQVELNGMDVQAGAVTREDARAALNLPPASFVVGSVGRLSPEKGHADLLEAAAMLPPEVPLMLVLAGDGPSRASLEARAAALGLGARVQFLGARRDLETIYPAFDAFALPSHTEGSPMVLLEALAHGIPVIATRVGSVPDMLADGHEGILAHPRDVAGLGAALNRAASDPALRARFAAAGRERYAREFRLSRWLDRMEAVYRSLCPGPAR